jgi:hypothetical protein
MLKSTKLMAAVLASLIISIASVIPISVSAATQTIPFTGWTASLANPTEIPTSSNANSLSPEWVNGNGCGGYYTGSNPLEMQCKDTATTLSGTRVVIRVGFWTGTNGFGWSKSWYYHNLAMQPTIDTIRSGSASGSYSSRNYEVYHQTNGVIDQEVIVVADITDISFQGVATPDYAPVGELTGYCLTGSGVTEATCPDWVNSTL